MLGIILGASDMNEQNIKAALIKLIFQQRETDNKQVDLTDK